MAKKQEDIENKPNPKTQRKSEFFFQTLWANHKYPKKRLFRERVTLYIILFASLLGWFLLFKSYTWTSTLQFITLSEFISSIIALIIGAMALIKHYTRHNHKYLFIGFGFLYVSILHALQAVDSSPYFAGKAIAVSEEIMFQNWINIGFVLAIFFFASWIYWFIDKYNKLSNTHIYGTIVLLFIAGIATTYFYPMGALSVLHLVSIVIFGATLMGYLAKGFWKVKYFEHWFTMAIGIILFSNILRLLSSSPFDTMFTGAYVFQMLGYSFTIIGLLMSMYLAFEEVEEGKEKIDTILRSIGDGVFVVDIAGTIVLINEVAEKLSGYSFSEAKGKSYRSIFKLGTEENPDKPYPPFIENVMKTKKIKEMAPHTILWKKDGISIPVADSAAPILDGTGTVIGCVVVIRDISRQREIERTKDNFLSVAAHQLRTPLGAMRWNLEMLLSGDIGKLNKDLEEHLKQIYESDRRMIHLVNDLLNISRIDQNRIADNPKETNIVPVIIDIISEMKAELFKRKVKILFDGKNTKLPDIVIDPNRLRDVLLNLISNAIKYNKRNGTVTIRAKESETSIDIIIQDTGMGIPKSEHSDLFSKFFRASNARSSAADGTGLGLFVVKSYVAGWGGSIRFDSNIGVGSTFYISIPKKPKHHTLDKNLAAKPHTSK